MRAGRNWSDPGLPQTPAEKRAKLKAELEKMRNLVHQVALCLGRAEAAIGRADEFSRPTRTCLESFNQRVKDWCQAAGVQHGRGYGR